MFFVQALTSQSPLGGKGMAHKKGVHNVMADWGSLYKFLMEPQTRSHRPVYHVEFNLPDY